MRVAVYVPLAVSVIAALAARPLADRLPPRLATWLLMTGGLVLAAATWATLAVLTLATAVRLPALAALGGLSVRVLGRGDPVPAAIGVAAAVALAGALASAVLAAVRRTRALIGTHREAGQIPGGRQLVIVTDDAPDAYTLPGWPGRIIVTSAMLAALTDSEAAVLVAHEQAHVTGRHHLFTAAARVAAAANPLLRPLAAAVGYSVERWADERAATAAGSRLLAAHAVASAALAGTSEQAAAGRAAAALAASGPHGRAPHTRHRHPGPVPRRVAALLVPPARLRPLLLVAAIALVVLASLAVTDSATDLHGLIEIAQSALA